MFFAVILFADDLCLMAPTRSALEQMINRCSTYCTKLGLAFNEKKSKVIVFSKVAINYDNFKPLYLNGRKIDYVDSIKYLGATIVSDKGLTFSSVHDLSSFYRASNSILRAVKKPSDEVLLQLLYSNCTCVVCTCVFLF